MDSKTDSSGPEDNSIPTDTIADPAPAPSRHPSQPQPGVNPHPNLNANANVNPDTNKIPINPNATTSEGFHDNVGNDVKEEGGKKSGGLLGKVKEVFKPKGKSNVRTENEDLTAGDAAEVKPEGERHEQANKDLNRE